MRANSMMDQFVNVNNMIQKLHDLFRCQICFNIKDEDSTVFYWSCHHIYCLGCIGRGKACVICSDDNDEKGKQAKLVENENILAIFRSLANYESTFLQSESKIEQKNLSKSQIYKTPKRQKKKNDSFMDIIRIDDKNDSQKKKKGINVSKRNHKGETPLHLACRKANITLMQELIDAGANPNLQDNAGWTPLHDSIVFGRIDVIKFLLENGARVNTPGHENTTALHQAVTERNSEVIRLLMKYGANKNARDIYGETPMDLARKYNFAETEEIMMTTPVKFKSKSRLLDTSITLQRSDTALYGFNLSDSESSLLERFAKQFKYKRVEMLLLQSSGTYIITSDPEPKVTWSLIPGVLMASHVLSVKWMEDSISNNSIQNIEKYEMTGGSYEGFEKSRQNQVDQLPGLFSGCHFFFGGHFELYRTKNSTFPKTDLKLLVERNGGIILTRNPDPESLALEKTIPYHAPINSSLSKTSYYIIYSKESWDPAPKYNMTHMKTLPVEWLLASIFKFQLIDPTVDQSYMEYI